ncbi:hypothetical protein SGFS_045120 [Streptomyces graminofaciens]|uniref:Lipoprotein n=1 Tax=Streptomyces graminofaciens TaxID=68212 RepID=A0ABN5VIM6_9ACTN|nr:hypothetical protein [Streptomyces graminofaciens]BBC33218.1 hypothetical protein SGFS_045120 [Streptomyces graminofaciens]
MGLSVMAGRTSVVAGLATVALAAGLTACTGGSDDGEDKAASMKACTAGTYAWSGIRQWEELAELADPINITKKTAFYEAKLKPVGDNRYRPKVTGAPKGVGTDAVIKALGKHLKTEERLAYPSEPAVPETAHVFENGTGDLKGSYFAWSSVELVEADFTYTCEGSEPVKGHVVSYKSSPTGWWDCSDEPAGGEAALKAARLSCPDGSRAARAA